MRQLKAHAKGDIAARLLETALKLHFNSGDGFAVIHLAANAKELLSGMIKGDRDDADLPASASKRTAREKSIATLGETYKIQGNPKPKNEIGAYINRVRNEIKHSDDKIDEDAIHVNLEHDVEMALFRAIDNFLHYVKAPTESMMRLINWHQYVSRYLARR